MTVFEILTLVAMVLPFIGVLIFKGMMADIRAELATLVEQNTEAKAERDKFRNDLESHIQITGHPVLEQRVTHNEAETHRIDERVTATREYYNEQIGKLDQNFEKFEERVEGKIDSLMSNDHDQLVKVTEINGTLKLIAHKLDLE